MAIKLLKECYEESISDEKCYSQGDIFALMVELLLDMEAYEDVVNLYRQKLAAERSANKSHLEQVSEYFIKSALIIVIFDILQRNITKAEQDNLQFMSEYI